MKTKTVALCLLTALSTTAADSGTKAVGWRTDWTGRYSDATPVLEWAPAKSVLWRTETRQWGNATPVVVGDRLFVTEEQDTLVCLNTGDGSVLWRQSVPWDSLLSDELKAKYAEMRQQAAAVQKELSPIQQEERKALEPWNEIRKQLKQTPDDQALKQKNEEFTKLQQEFRTRKAPLEGKLKELNVSQPPGTHPTNGYASPTPVSDGTYVYVLFGSGMTACFDLDGTQRWVVLVTRPEHGWGHSASPVLVDGKLIVHTHRAVAALNPADGQELWKTSGNGTWGTPLPVKLGENYAIITTGGDMIRTRDGRIIAKNVVQLPWGSAIVQDDIVYAADEQGARAVRLPTAADDEVKPEILWQATPKKNRYYAAPLYHQGLLYVINQASHLTVLDAQTGDTVYEKDLELKNTAYPSPVLAGDKILISHDSGWTLVIEPGREYKETARNKLEAFRATPVFNGGRMFVRTLNAVYCIGR